MLALYLHYRWTDETVAAQKPENDKLMQAGLMMGVMDDDMSGKLSQAELKGNMGENIKKYFAMIDGNKDGGLDQKELDAAMKLMPRRGRGGGMPTASAVPPAGPGGR
jgi:hypothetical protein